VVEWLNAVVLWVNVDGVQYENLFMDGGRKMTWFAGSRCGPETPVVGRLIRAPYKEARNSDSGGDSGDDATSAMGDTVLLFCRKTGEPYVFMGRVVHDRYKLTCHPVEIVWSLVDYDAAHTAEGFRHIVEGTAG